MWVKPLGYLSYLNGCSFMYAVLNNNIQCVEGLNSDFTQPVNNCNDYTVYNACTSNVNIHFNDETSNMIINQAYDCSKEIICEHI